MVEGIDVIGLDLKGSLVVFFLSDVVTDLLKTEGAIVVGSEVIGVHFYHSAVVLDSLVEFPQLPQCESSVAEEV